MAIMILKALCVASALVLPLMAGYSTSPERRWGAFDARMRQEVGVKTKGYKEYCVTKGEKPTKPTKIEDVVPKDLAQAPGDVRFTTFTFSDGDFSFDGPAAWAKPLDSADPTRKAFFVGPVDHMSRAVVFLGVNRYPGKTASVEHEIDRLQADKAKQIVSHEVRMVDQRPAHFLTIREQAAIPLWGPEILPLALHESFVLIDDEPDIYVLEYVSSPELHEKYQPIFDRLVTSFHLHNKNKKPR